MKRRPRSRSFDEAPFAEPTFSRPRAGGWLRRGVLALLVANGAYFAWSQGWLALFGWLPERFGQREPHRVEQQIRPGALQIQPPAGALQTPPPAGAPARN